MGFKVPKRTANLVFEGQYEGAEVKARLDVAVGFFIEIQDMVADNRNLDVFRAFGDGVLISWNLEDDDGTPLPANGDGMLKLPATMANAIIEAWTKGVQELPTPLSETSNGGSMSVAVPSKSPGR